MTEAVVRRTDEAQAVLYIYRFFFDVFSGCNGKIISEWKWLHNAVTQIIMEYSYGSVSNVTRMHIV